MSLRLIVRFLVIPCMVSQFIMCIEEDNQISISLGCFVLDVGVQ